MFTKFWILSVLALAWLAYDWNTHSQGKKQEEWWSLSGPRRNHREREREGESGRGRERRGGKRKEGERERKRGK